VPAIREARVDVVVLGGGIAGLWTLARLRAEGYAAAPLGAGQTVAAQGIVHGGLKYALDLKLGRAARALADMPALWRRCLAGQGELDLRAARLNAGQQLFWLPQGARATLVGFLASQAVRAHTRRLPPAEWPPLLRQETVGAVHALDEPVLDVPSVVRALAMPLAAHIRRVDAAAMRFEGEGWRLGPLRIAGETRDGGALRLHAGSFVLAAGAGNEAVLGRLVGAGAAQRRPLHMLMLHGLPEPPLYAHCFDAGEKPRLTITSHRTEAGDLVWYIGGELAEAGAALPPDGLAARGRAELARLLPRLDLSGVAAAGLRIDRAEPRQPLGRRPDRPVLRAAGDALFVWPSKLAFAPQAAAEVAAALAATGLPRGPDETAALAALPFPGYAAPPWEEASWM
jgi:hypothetical protein